MLSLKISLRNIAHLRSCEDFSKAIHYKHSVPLGLRELRKLF
jgi:hypothetical protein